LLFYFPLVQGLERIAGGISIYCGFQFIGIQIAGLHNNIGLLQVQEGSHPDTGAVPWKQQVGVEVILKAIEKKSQQTMMFAKWQSRFFYMGIISFLAWRIWDMYLITN